MSASDALIQPIYNCRYRESISLVDSNGAPIASSAPDTEISKDSAGFAAATNELTAKTGTPVGECYIDFTYAEMGAQEVRIVPKSTGALTRGFSLFPQRLPVLRSGTAQAGAAGSITLDSGASAKDGAYVGCWVRASNNTPAGIQGQVRKISGYTGSTKVATVVPDWDNNPTSATTFEVLVPSDMSMSTLLSTAAEVADAVHDEVFEGTDTFRHLERAIMAFIVGEVTTAGKNFRDQADTKDRLVYTLPGSGVRTVAKDLT